MYSELYVQPNNYQRPFPEYNRPKIIGFLSLDSNRHYNPDHSELRFAKCIENKRVSFDLNSHHNEAKHRPKNLDEQITHLLQFLLDQEKRLCIPASSTLDTSHIFCYRGLMTMIACTPYERKEPWRVVACLFKGNIYFCSITTDEKIERLNNMSERDKQCTSWGYKFEQFLLSDSPASEPTPDTGADECAEFSLVLKTNLNKHNIVFGAEMDGIRCDRGTMDAPPLTQDHNDIIQYLSSKEFIELKTNRHIEFSNQHTTFRRYKTIKWFCQSFLAGVDTILCGFRNDEGIVEELKLFSTRDIVKMSERFWDPNVCFNFLDTFFTYVKRSFEKEIRKKHSQDALKDIQKLPPMSLHFEWSPRSSVRITDGYNHELNPILPEWFTSKFGEKR